MHLSSNDLSLFFYVIFESLYEPLHGVDETGYAAYTAYYKDGDVKEHLVPLKLSP